MKFEWDAAKNRENIRKHRVTFEEAATVFADWLSRTVPDPDHSEAEERLLLLGESNRRRLLVVSHTLRGKSIRIISARRANTRERKLYEEDT